MPQTAPVHAPPIIKAVASEPDAEAAWPEFVERPGGAPRTETQARAVARFVHEQAVREATAGETRGVRERPPTRRASETTAVKIGGHSHYFTLGFYPDGRLCEVFVNAGKEGSTTRGYADVVGILLSHYLQIGGDLSTIAEKLRFTRFAPDGPVVGAPAGIKTATSPIDALAQLLMRHDDDLPPSQGFDI